MHVCIVSSVSVGERPKLGLNPGSEGFDECNWCQGHFKMFKAFLKISLFSYV